MKRLYLAFLVALPFLILSVDAFARAGGGGSGKGSGGIVGLILLPFVYLAYWLVKTRSSMRDTKISTRMNALAAQEPLWNERDLRARIEQIYFKVQNAWNARDQELAREYLSDRIYMKHKIQTDTMLANNTQNVLENINLINIKFVSIDDQPGSAHDTCIAYIEGSMIDYTVNHNTGEVTNNKERKETKFQEFWTFVIQDNKWVLDEIDQQASWSDFKRFKIESHKL